MMNSTTLDKKDPEEMRFPFNCQFIQTGNKNK